MSCYPLIYKVVRLIPRGKVATYGQIAELAGLFGKPRVVGYALHRVVASESDIPWHRVINAKGKVSRSSLRDGNDDLQQLLLEAEGVVFENRKVDLTEYRWKPAFIQIDRLVDQLSEEPLVESLAEEVD